MSLRPPQLPLRLDAAAAPAERWHDGAALAYLGGALTLRLDTAQAEATRVGDELHLPLPPEASARQVRDRAEAWLRDEALRLLRALVTQKSALAGRHGAAPPPALRLSFASRAHWVETEPDGGLRCHWRLIEQPLPVIAASLERALRAAPAAVAEPLLRDLFA